jgi:hypothetical protein
MGESRRCNDMLWLAIVWNRSAILDRDINLENKLRHEGKDIKLILNSSLKHQRS